MKTSTVVLCIAIIGSVRSGNTVTVEETFHSYQKTKFYSLETADEVRIKVEIDQDHDYVSGHIIMVEPVNISKWFTETCDSSYPYQGQVQMKEKLEIGRVRFPNGLGIVKARKKDAVGTNPGLRLTRTIRAAEQELSP